MYEKEFTVKINGKEEKLLFKPLTGRYIGKFYKVLGALSKLDGKADKDFFSVLDEETITLLHTLETAMFNESYPGKYTPEELDMLVSKHLLVLLEPLMKTNVPEQ